MLFQIAKEQVIMSALEHAQRKEVYSFFKKANEISIPKLHGQHKIGKYGKILQISM